MADKDAPADEETVENKGPPSEAEAAKAEDPKAEDPKAEDPKAEEAPAATASMDDEESSRDDDSGSIRYAADAETAVWDEGSLKDIGAVGAPSSGAATSPDPNISSSPSVEISRPVQGKRPTAAQGPSLVVTLLLAAGAGILVYALVRYLL